jgi:hypothetical protein
LGFHVRRVWFLAWLTLLPVTVCFPQISQLRDILSFLQKKPFGQYSVFIPENAKNVKPYSRNTHAEAFLHANRGAQTKSSLYILFTLLRHSVMNLFSTRGAWGGFSRPSLSMMLSFPAP